jgi:hypothetical protein
MNRILKSILPALFICLVPEMEAQDEDSLVAYYTRIDSGEEFEKTARVGVYPDIIIRVAPGLEVVFWRGTSYLPVLRSGGKEWPFEEVVPRSGDGSEKMPDRLNRYSYVRIIEDLPERVVIHWRYVPDFGDPSFTGVVDEYFTFRPDLTVKRTIRKGTATIDEWNDPSNQITQELKLGFRGISVLRTMHPSTGNAQPGPSRIGNSSPRLGESVCAGFQFNEGDGNTTVELSRMYYSCVKGHKTLWKEGISGTCLQFDGYYSAVEVPGYFTQDVQDQIRVEGWVALGAYPFGWAPVVHQSTWDQKGFYLGINERGVPGFHLAAGGKWHVVMSDSVLGLFRWYYLAGTLDGEGNINLYLNGEKVASIRAAPGPVDLSNSELMVGLNREKFPAGPGRHRIGKYPSLFGVDGLIDEVKVSTTAREQAEIRETYHTLKGPKLTLSVADIEPRQWPRMSDEQDDAGFGARYTRLAYYETWDNMWRVSDHPDVVVEFDKLPCRIISWRGLSNGPVLVTENNLWVGDQSSENYKELDAEGEAEGCCEHMSDKQCRHAHIRIIENTPARVVLHYRYGMVDSRYIFPDINPETGWGDWADEIWTIYPDGIAVRHLERGMIWGDSWVETMFFSAPGQRPEDVVELEAFTVVGEEGRADTLSWRDGSPDGVVEDVIISMVNTKSAYRAFNIYPEGSAVEIFGGHHPDSHFHWWNHWPVSQITSDGRSARHADRAAHSSLVWGIPEKEFLIYGLTDKPAAALVPLASSWNNPPQIRKLQGARSGGYRQERRAYTLYRESDHIGFSLAGRRTSPVLNPCFVIRNWDLSLGAEVTINGKPVPEGGEYRQGMIRDTDGSRTLVIWMNLNETNDISITIQPKKT